MLTPIPLHRVLPAGQTLHHYASSADEWREIAAEVMRQGQPPLHVTVRGLLIDPFDNTMMPIDLPVSIPTMSRQAMMGMRLDALVDVRTVAAAIGQPHASISSIPLMEDLATGDYLVCLCQSFDDTVPRSPGFFLVNRPVVGRAVILFGVEVCCPRHEHLMDQHRSMTSSDVLPPVTWLSINEVRAARAAQRTDAIGTMQRLMDGADRIWLSGSISPSVDETQASCWSCGSKPARKKCKRCLRAYYCDSECQARHWEKHRAVCVKDRGR